MFEVIQNYASEKEFQENFGDQAPAKDPIKRLHEVSRLRTDSPLVITTTCEKRFSVPPVKMFACPLKTDYLFPDADLGVFLLIHLDGSVRFLFLSAIAANKGRIEMVASPCDPWPWPEDEFQFTQLLLEKVYVQWNHNKEIDELEVFITYNTHRGEIVYCQGKNDPPSRRVLKQGKLKFPRKLFRVSGNNVGWPDALLLSVSNSDQWLETETPFGTSKRTNRLGYLLKSAYKSNSDDTEILTLQAPSVKKPPYQGRILAADIDFSGQMIWAVTNTFDILRWNLDEKISEPAQRWKQKLFLRPSAAAFIQSAENSAKPLLLITIHNRGLLLLDPSSDSLSNNNDTGDEFYEEQIFLPSTITQIGVSSNDTPHILLLENTGRILSVQVRTRKEITKKYREVYKNAGLKKFDWKETKIILDKITVKNGKLNPDPGLVFHELWDRVLMWGISGSDTNIRKNEEPPLVVWKKLNNYILSQNIKDTQSVCLLRLLLIKVLINTPSRLPKKGAGNPIVREILNRSLKALGEKGDDHLYL